MLRSDSPTVRLHPRTPCTPPLLFLFALTFSQMVVFVCFEVCTHHHVILSSYERITQIYAAIIQTSAHTCTLVCQCRGEGVARLSTPHLIHVITHPPLQKSASHIPLLYLYHYTSIRWGKMEEKAAAWQCDSRLYGGLVSKCLWPFQDLVEAFIGVKPGSEAWRGLFSCCISALRCLLSEQTVQALRVLQRAAVCYSLCG